MKPIFENVIDMIGGLAKKKKLKVVPTKYVSQSIKDIKPVIRGRKRGPFLRPAFIGPFVPEKPGHVPGKKKSKALAKAERLRGEEDALLRGERKAKREAKEEEEPAGFYFDPILGINVPIEEPAPSPLPLDPVEFPYGMNKDGSPSKKRGPKEKPKAEPEEKAEPKLKLKVVPKLPGRLQDRLQKAKEAKETKEWEEGLAPLRKAQAKKEEKKKASSKESSPASSPKYESPDTSPRSELTASGKLRKKKLKRI
jgi:hypothetical protein